MRDVSTLRVSPNSPVAAQIMEDKVIDMLLFLTFRFMKNFAAYKEKRLQEIELYAATLNAMESNDRGAPPRATLVCFGFPPLSI